MFFRRKIWLWLYIRTGIILGGELNIPEQHGKKHCYQLNRFHCSYEEAENYRGVRGGHLAYTWNLGVQELLWDFLEEGSKWWIGPHLKHLGKHQERKNPGKALRWVFTKVKSLLLLWNKRQKKIYIFPLLYIEKSVALLHYHSSSEVFIL